ncbi:MAG: hypothetical protein FJY67_09970 [Calditrichaeota bacterium]|nr:hypothetical protein [Calditrichota bacterium]
MVRYISLLIALALASCTSPTLPDRSTPDADSIRIGPNGPLPLGGWKVIERNGIFDSEEYRNTVGWPYICIEDNLFLDAFAIQVYLNTAPNDPAKSNWSLFKKFRISERFLYIDDHLKSYWGWAYVIFIYRERGE